MTAKPILIASFIIVVSITCALLFFFLTAPRQTDETLAQVLFRPTQPQNMGHETRSPTTLSPALQDFVAWYKPMIMDASPEVGAVMKQFDPYYRSGWANRDRQIEEFLPVDEWLQKLLDMGVVIDNYRDYTAFLSRRWLFYHAKNDPDRLRSMKKRLGLPPDASWEEVQVAGIWEAVTLYAHTNQAMQADPKVYGGKYSKVGGFIPFRENTVYVKNASMSKGIGVPPWVLQELRDRQAGQPPSREIPSHIDIIYLDETNSPLQEVPKNVPGHVREFQPADISESDIVSEPTPDIPPLDVDNKIGEHSTPPKSSKSLEVKFPDIPETEVDLEGHFTPQLPTDNQVEARLDTSISPERMEKAQQVLAQYGPEEGLRRLRKTDPEAAKQLERRITPTR